MSWDTTARNAMGNYIFLARFSDSCFGLFVLVLYMIATMYLLGVVALTANAQGHIETGKIFWTLRNM